MRSGRTARLVALLAAVALTTPVGAAPPAGALDATAGYEGRCSAADRDGVTVVVDFGDLDGNEGRSAETLVRCAPPRYDAHGDVVARTGLEALHEAGIESTGVARWGSSFVCRLEGRPAADEVVAIREDPAYVERCLDTPPANAYWGYWHADGSGTAWEYSSLGVLGRTVTPGGFEGWSFSHDAGADSNPPPEVAPVNPDGGPRPDPAPETPDPEPPTTTPERPSVDPAASRAAGWLVRELGPGGQMAGPAAGVTDWGLTIDTLFALQAAGTGASAVRKIVSALDAHAGAYLGPELFDDADARLGGQTAKLLVAAVVAGKDPRAFGRSQLAPGRFDLRAETLGLLATGRTDKGRLSDRGTGSDTTNVFSQSLAVIGLARSGGVPRSAVDYLLTQQCRAGFFRMFAQDGKSCDAGAGAPDTDGTAMALQALLTARDQGVTGLDAAIDRTASWLVGHQRSDGSFGGGVSTSAANSNSTGLAAQTLKATGRTASYAKARRWVSRLQATATAGKGLRDEVGAVAYDPRSYAAARTKGLGVQRDQWRRATAQAVFAFAPVSFAELGAAPVTGDPDRPSGEPDRGTGAAPAPGPAQPGTPAPPPGVPSVPLTPAPATAPAPPRAGTPAERLAGYLTRQLAGGDHVLVRSGGSTFVDYDLTADTVVALRLLGAEPKAAARATRFLLDRRSVQAYAHGDPYEDGDAAYAEALAKLVLVARTSPVRAHARVAKDLAHRLTTLRDVDGGGDGDYRDRGAYGDESGSTVRQSSVALALLAAGEDGLADAAAERLVSATCDDGTFATALDTECETGDLTATAQAAQALNAAAPPRTAGSAATGNAVPVAWSTARADAVARAAAALVDATRLDGTVVSPGGAVDVAASGQAAAGRHALGLDLSATSHLLGSALLTDGGLPTRVGGKASALEAVLAAAPAVAGHGVLGAPGFPFVPATRAPLTSVPAPAEATDSSARDADEVVVSRGLLAAAAGAFAALLGLVALLLARTARTPDVPLSERNPA